MAVHSGARGTANATGLRVACVGDSLTRGDRDANEQVAAQVGAGGQLPDPAAERLGRQFSVFNFGHGGAAS